MAIRARSIRVRLTPSDATTSGVAVTSAGLTIANSAPSTTVVVDDDSPDSNAVLTATAAKADVDGDAVTLTYVWRVNGIVKKTTTATTSVTDSFDLGIAGNGDTGDAVTVAVTPSDGIASGTSASATATVVADTNAPAAPGSSAVSVTTASIALDWPDNTEHDVAGYRVYRGASASGAFTLLTPSLLTTSTYTDGSPVVGDLYYRVTAVDTTGNESLPTTAVVSRSIALRAATTGQSTGTTLTITKPSGTASGDVVVAMIDLAGTASITAPSGWTVVRNDTNGTALRQAIFWHVAGSSDSSYPFTFGAAQGATAILAAYVGVDTASPFDPSTGQTGSGTAITGPSLSASANAALIMVSGVATSTTIAPASGMAERGEVGSSGKAKLDTEFADQLLGPAGTTGNRRHRRPQGWRKYRPARRHSGIGQSSAATASGDGCSAPPETSWRRQAPRRSHCPGLCPRATAEPTSRTTGSIRGQHPAASRS